MQREAALRGGWSSGLGAAQSPIPELRNLGALQKPPPASRGWKLAALPLPNMGWEMISPQGQMRTGWIFLQYTRKKLLSNS